MFHLYEVKKMLFILVEYECVIILSYFMSSFEIKVIIIESMDIYGIFSEV